MVSFFNCYLLDLENKYRKEVLGMQSRFRSKVMWTSILSLIVFVSKTFYHYEIPEVDTFINLVLGVLLATGIINNPTDANKL